MVLSVVSIVAFLAGLAAALLARMFLDAPIPVLGNFARLQYAENPGIAFGLHFPSPFQEILILIALGIVFAVALRSKTVLSKVGFGLIIGGALGNIADRLIHGMVTDYFAVGTFPIFNVADSCITVGVGILLVESLLLMRSNRI